MGWSRTTAGCALVLALGGCGERPTIEDTHDTEVIGDTGEAYDDPWGDVVDTGCTVEDGIFLVIAFSHNVPCTECDREEMQLSGMIENPCPDDEIFYRSNSSCFLNRYALVDGEGIDHADDWACDSPPRTFRVRADTWTGVPWEVELELGEYAFTGWFGDDVHEAQTTFSVVSGGDT